MALPRCFLHHEVGDAHEAPSQGVADRRVCGAVKASIDTGARGQVADLPHRFIAGREGAVSVGEALHTEVIGFSAQGSFSQTLAVA
jgi:hypothetical protein